MSDVIRLNNIVRLRRLLGRVKSVNEEDCTAIVHLIEEDNAEVEAVYKLNADSSPYVIPEEQSLVLIDQYQQGLFYITTIYKARKVSIEVELKTLRSSQ